MSAVAFLIELDETSQLDLVYEAIFQAVLNLDAQRSFHLRAGAIHLTLFSQSITAVGRRPGTEATSQDYVLTDARELRARLALAFAAGASGKYHSLNVEALPEILLRHQVECVNVSDISLMCADAIHKDLAPKMAGYLGFFEVDRGDPLTLVLAANALVSLGCYDSGELKWIVPAGDETNVRSYVSWARNLSFVSIQPTSDLPSFLAGEQFSAIGEKNAVLLKSIAHSSHAEKVLISLMERSERDSQSADFEVRFGEAEFSEPRADVRKLRDYCLNEQHSKPDGTPGDGRAKAYRFRRLLGITRNDWLFLGQQLAAGLHKALLKKTRRSQYGVKYEVSVPVIGRNGQTKLVTCAWIIRPGESPFLVTAYIPDDADTSEPGLLAHLIVEKSRESDFSQRLYAVAHEQATKAAEETTTTPLWLEGYTEVISEGVCGFSWVRLPDARSSFARWLKQNGLGSKRGGPGYLVFADSPSQSLERAQRFCEAFAQVLRLNGIECEVGWRYD